MDHQEDKNKEEEEEAGYHSWATQEEAEECKHNNKNE